MFSVSKKQLIFLYGLALFVLFYIFYSQTPAKSENKPIFGQIIVYNRVPKTASTTLTNAIAYDLFKQNGFNVIHVNITKNRQTLSPGDQFHIVSNVSTWAERLPAFYHGHLAFIDFTRFGYPNPIYINLLREPLDRLLSHYYFLRYGDNYRIGLKRSRAGNNETFDDCVSRGGKDCDVKQLWVQIPYFCGHHHFCNEPGNEEALVQAKRNLLEHYALVGLTERLPDFIGLLENSFPHFFKGALEHYMSLDGERAVAVSTRNWEHPSPRGPIPSGTRPHGSPNFHGLVPSKLTLVDTAIDLMTNDFSETRAHLRSTKRKVAPNDQTISVIKRSPIYKMERQFYDFAKEEFDFQFKKATNGTGRLEMLQKGLLYHYEKIKPERL